jgi:hypothetical protein
LGDVVVVRRGSAKSAEGADVSAALLVCVAVAAYVVGRWHEYHLLNLKWRSIPKTAKRAFIAEARKSRAAAPRET